MDRSGKIRTLFHAWSGNYPDSITALPVSGSSRRYYRIISGEKSFLAAHNNNERENRAFINFTDHFRNYDLNVPEIHATDLVNDLYLLEDLGDLTLFDLVQSTKEKGEPFSRLVDIYKTVLSDLIRFQVVAGKTLDFSYCHPVAEFSIQSIAWDLNYFKYYFLKPLLGSFDENALEADFLKISDDLGKVDRSFFMYRDFQSRNILLKNGKPFYIDYQGGRRGALQYDLASLLFQARAGIPYNIREDLYQHYTDELKMYIEMDEDQFRDQYEGFVLIRLLQVLGAYGYRGLFERKSHFLKSIPYAMENLEWYAENTTLTGRYPSLFKTVEKLIRHCDFRVNDTDRKSSEMQVHIYSFSYKKGFPEDRTEHGGGFVFDCRALPNPGREEKYRYFSGTDREVIDYLESGPETRRFLDSVTRIVSQSVDEYQKRGFKYLSVGFGCTGGQHRSVYCAEKLASYLNKKYDLNVSVTHTEKENWQERL